MNGVAIGMANRKAATAVASRVAGTGAAGRRAAFGQVQLGDPVTQLRKWSHSNKGKAVATGGATSRLAGGPTSPDGTADL